MERGNIATPWIKYPMNFRPDQLSKFQELYPDKPLAPTIRMLLDTFLDGKKPTHRRLDEVRRLREKTAKQLVMLEVEEEQLQKEEIRSIMDDAVEKHRLQYLEEHPEVLREHSKGTISSKGYELLQRELKMKSVKQVQEYLAKQNESSSQ